jgi:hypothetical protein
MSDRSNAPITVKSTDAARQGVTGHNVRYVLIIGIVAAVALMTVVYLGFFAP